MREPLFNNIEVNNYLEPIRQLDQYYKDIPVSYYKNILSKYKHIETLNKNHEDILLQYLFCRPNAKIIVAFSEHNVVSIKNKLKKETNFYYHKSLSMNKKEIIALIYQLLYDECTMYQYLKNYVNKLGFKDENKLEIYFYENIAGDTKIDFEMDHFTNDSFDELILMASIFLNKNSLELLKMQDIEKIYKFNNTDCKKMFDKILYNINHKITLLELNSRIIISSFILYLYGFRYCNDIDIKYIYINKKYDKLSKIDIEKIIEDIVIKYKSDKYISYYEIVLNPEYHLYFLGNKVNILDIEMYKKRYREDRPRAFVDIIYVNQILKTKYKFPKLTKRDIKFYNTIQYFLKNRYNLNYNIDSIKDLINKNI
jgi:hypothetical protein